MSFSISSYISSVEEEKVEYNSDEEEETLVIETEKKDTRRGKSDKVKKGFTVDAKNNYAKKRKEMYKNKSKLQSSTNSDEIHCRRFLVPRNYLHLVYFPF